MIEAVWWVLVGALVGPEFAVGDELPAAPLGQRSSANVCATASGFFAVWSDKRTDPGDFGEPSAVYGSRIDDDGNVLDGAGIRIAERGERPAVASSGDGVLVVWVEEVESGGMRVLGARVAAGLVLDASPIVIRAASTSQGLDATPAVAFDGTHYVIVWHEQASLPGVHVARVSTDGERVDSTGTSTTGLWPAVACVGSRCLVTWRETLEDSPGIRGVIMEQGGQLTEQPGQLSTAIVRSGSARVAADGDRFLVAWKQGIEYVVQRIDIDGAALDPMPIVLAEADNLGDDMIDVAYSGLEFVAVWEHGTELAARAVQPDGTPSPDAHVIAGREHARMAGREGTVLVAHRNALGVRLGAGGAPIDVSPFPLVLGANGQMNPRAARAGEVILVIWEDTRHPGQTWWYAGRVREDGEALDPQGIRIARSGLGIGEPSVATDGSTFAVVWSEFREGNTADIFGLRIRAADGAVLDDVPRALAAGDTARETPWIVFDGERYFVAWREGFFGARSIVGARFSANLEPIDAEPLGISPGGSDVSDGPKLATAGAAHLVRWAPVAGGNGAAIVSRDGIVTAEISMDVLQPIPASDGVRFLLAGGSAATRFSLDGTLLDQVPITWTLGDAPVRNVLLGAVAFDGRHYVVPLEIIYPEEPLTGSLDQNIDVHVQWITADGRSLVSTTPISERLDDETSPAVVPGSIPGTAVIFYARNEPAVANLRVFGRVISPPAEGFVSPDSGCGCRAGDAGAPISGAWLVALLLVIGRPSRARRRCALLAFLAAIGAHAGCGGQASDDDTECRDPTLTIDSGIASCWIHDCPESPGADVCGTCVNPGHDVECPPGFVCSCAKQCVRGPRSYDGGGSCLPSPPADAGPEPDARTYAWPLCDDRHLPCST